MNDFVTLPLKLSAMIKTRQELIESPNDLRPHIVLLGAGASRAAFPKGDAAGRSVPVMDDLVDVIELQSSVEETDLENTRTYLKIEKRPMIEQQFRDGLSHDFNISKYSACF